MQYEIQEYHSNTMISEYNKIEPFSGDMIKSALASDKYGK